ncbi:LiaF transmembrane domain-containing protein [Desertivirga brevis]|uniref:LiaF transmembrane domain-containing protein n=1 Tax=Desertivirga brevis TaxID=2810310 RepID=UPI001A96EF8D|nr:DUF5668 domain-containing protein [Pedobacter sp. SYSU D00873]
MENNISNKAKGSRVKVTMGIVLVVFGALMFGDNFGLAVPSWLTSWPVLLILTGIVAGIKHQFKKPGALVLILTGTVFLIDKLLPGFEFHELVFPLLVTSLGIFLILKRNEQADLKHCHQFGGYKDFKDPHK